MNKCSDIYRGIYGVMPNQNPNLYSLNVFLRKMPCLFKEYVYSKNIAVLINTAEYRTKQGVIKEIG